MVRPLSNDPRKRVVTAVSKGESCLSAAVRFGVAVSSVVKWSQRYRSTGSIAPRKMGGQPEWSAPLMSRRGNLSRSDSAPVPPRHWRAKQAIGPDGARVLVGRKFANTKSSAA